MEEETLRTNTVRFCVRRFRFQCFLSVLERIKVILSQMSNIFRTEGILGLSRGLPTIYNKYTTYKYKLHML